MFGRQQFQLGAFGGAFMTGAAFALGRGDLNLAVMFFLGSVGMCIVANSGVE